MFGLKPKSLSYVKHINCLGPKKSPNSWAGAWYVPEMLKQCSEGTILQLNTFAKHADKGQGLHDFKNLISLNDIIWQNMFSLKSISLFQLSGLCVLLQFVPSCMNKSQHSSFHSSRGSISAMQCWARQSWATYSWF